MSDITKKLSLLESMRKLVAHADNHTDGAEERMDQMVTYAKSHIGPGELTTDYLCELASSGDYLSQIPTGKEPPPFVVPDARMKCRGMDLSFLQSVERGDHLAGIAKFHSQN